MWWRYCGRFTWSATDPGPGAEAEGAPVSGRARWHDVRVELRRPNFETLVRPGYYR